MEGSGTETGGTSAASTFKMSNAQKLVLIAPEKSRKLVVPDPVNPVPIVGPAEFAN
jgi:hypothetical protein